jgi:GxxExxY protein
MHEEGLSFEAEKRVQLACDGKRIGLLSIDHLVEGAVVVEVKALSHLLTSDEISQVVTYLAATNLPVGLLLNFGRTRLEYRRILPPRKLSWPNRIRRYLQPAR